MDLIPALELVSRVVERRTTLPILSHIRVISDGKVLTFVGTDLDTEVRVIVDVAAPKFDICAPANALTGAAKIAAPKFAVAGKKLCVGDDPVFTLNTLHSEDFPAVKIEKAKVSFQLPGDQLATDLLTLRPAVSTEEVRFYLNGVYFHVRDDRLIMAATDGHRLHRMSRPLPEGAAGMPGFIFPRRAIAIVLAAIEAAPAKPATIEIENYKVRVRIGDVTITTKAIDGTFPDYTRVIPTSPSGSCAVEAAAILPMANAAVMLSERVAHVELNFAANQARTKSHEAGTATADLTGERSGELPSAIGFNAAYLRQILETRPEETFTFGLGGPSDPALFTCGDPDFTAVLMPVRL